MNKEIEKLQRGCGKETCLKKFIIRGYADNDDRFKCGEEYPVGHVDKRMSLEKYPRFLCHTCKDLIKKKFDDLPVMVKSVSKYKKVQVRWLDAQTGFAAAMPVSDFFDEFEPLYNHTCGYLLCNDDEKVIVGFLMMDESENDPLIKHWQLIPKGMVKEIKELHL